MQNNWKNWCHELGECLKQPLPATRAHIKLAPGDRIEGLEARVWPADARHSAVTILLFPQNNQLYTLVMKRVEYAGVHSGQISFPGGQKDPDDADLLATAMREFHEETGIVIPQEQYLGMLSNLYIPPSNFLVQPYVAFLPALPPLSPDFREVQKLYSIPLSTLFDMANFRTEEIVVRVRNGESMSLSAPCYIVDDLKIWGATAMMISELSMVFENMDLLSRGF
jgi:8-oxo-dGTP pyrophosphatase MutT (NUDIX family)